MKRGYYRIKGIRKMKLLFRW